jgi:hypothetical protein
MSHHRRRNRREMRFASPTTAIPPMGVTGNRPPVPDVPEDLLDALRALVRSGDIFRSAFLSLGEGEPVDEFLDEHAPTLELADRVIDAWGATVGIGCCAIDERGRATETGDAAGLSRSGPPARAPNGCIAAPRVNPP